MLLIANTLTASVPVTPDASIVAILTDENSLDALAPRVIRLEPVNTTEVVSVVAISPWITKSYELESNVTVSSSLIVRSPVRVVFAVIALTVSEFVVLSIKRSKVAAVVATPPINSM